MSATPPLLDPSTFDAPASWRRIDFISDLHLGPHAPRTADAFAAYLRATPADAVIVLGDLFDIWIGDDAIVEGFETEFTERIAAAASVRPIGLMVGNRDFLLGADFMAACGLFPLADPTVMVAFGQRVLLSHGDSLCLADVPYQRFRSVVRAPEWQRQFLSRPLADRREEARRLREQSAAAQAPASGQETAPIDLDPATVAAWMREARTASMVHGHTHQPATHVLAPGLTRHVLSDWDLEHRRPRAEVLRWEASGFSRWPPEAVKALA